MRAAARYYIRKGLPNEFQQITVEQVNRTGVTQDMIVYDKMLRRKADLDLKEIWQSSNKGRMTARFFHQSGFVSEDGQSRYELTGHMLPDGARSVECKVGRICPVGG